MSGFMSDFRIDFENISAFGEFSIFQKDNVRTDKRLDIFISIRPMTMKFGEQVHLEELNQMRLIKQVLVSPSRQGHVKK